MTIGVKDIDAIPGLVSYKAKLIIVSLGVILQYVPVDLRMCKSDLFSVAMRLMIVSSWPIHHEKHGFITQHWLQDADRSRLQFGCYLRK